MLGLFIVVTYVEQRLLVLPNTAGKRSYMTPTLVYFSDISGINYCVQLLMKIVIVTISLVWLIPSTAHADHTTF